MDPFTIMAAATAAFNGVKKAVELGREVQDIYSQLSTWAGHVGDFHRAVAEIEMKQKNPGIFDKISFKKSDTAEAFDMFAAKQKLIDMEKEIYHMFLYGDLNHLGRDGYDEFRRMREEVRNKRNKMIMDQMKARQALFENIKFWGLVSLIVIPAILILYFIGAYVLESGQSAGRW
jgi:hypothetical protein